MGELLIAGGDIMDPATHQLRTADVAIVDGQIAAIAKVNDLILVTANVAEYQIFNGLLIENWLIPDESVDAF